MFSFLFWNATESQRSHCDRWHWWHLRGETGKGHKCHKHEQSPWSCNPSLGKPCQAWFQGYANKCVLARQAQPQSSSLPTPLVLPTFIRPSSAPIFPLFLLHLLPHGYPSLDPHFLLLWLCGGSPSSASNEWGFWRGWGCLLPPAASSAAAGCLPPPHQCAGAVVLRGGCRAAAPAGVGCCLACSGGGVCPGRSSGAASRVGAGGEGGG